MQGIHKKWVLEVLSVPEMIFLYVTVKKAEIGLYLIPLHAIWLQWTPYESPYLLDEKNKNCSRANERAKDAFQWRLMVF